MNTKLQKNNNKVKKTVVKKRTFHIKSNYYTFKGNPYFLLYIFVYNFSNKWRKNACSTY